MAQQRLRFPVLWQGPCKLLEDLRVLGCPRDVPWDLVAPHERQALRNHDQTLERLAERGGLSPAELLAVLEDLAWSQRSARRDPEAVPALLRAIAAFKGKQDRS